MRLRFVLPIAFAPLAVSPFAHPLHAAPLGSAALERPARPVVPVAADEQTYDIDLVVGLSGRCTPSRAAGQNLPCRAVKYFHGESGRAYFTIAVDDPADK